MHVIWEAVEEDYDVPPLPRNPTMAQIKTHKENKTRKSKTKACLFATVSPTIFSRIMTCSSAKAIWDFLKNEYQGDERIRGMRVLNLVREFEMQHMKESETIKDYSDRLIGIANKAQEQRRMIRQEGTTEGALQANLQQNSGGRSMKWKGKKGSASNFETAGTENNTNTTSSNKGGKYPSCQHREEFMQVLRKLKMLSFGEDHLYDPPQWQFLEDFPHMVDENEELLQKCMSGSEIEIPRLTDRERLEKLPQWLLNLKSLRKLFIASCLRIVSLPDAVIYSSLYLEELKFRDVRL
ncbi:hypothetical protein GH714_018234 [Hevea brasiliensis]|uniref:Uncharacterized protein n=1 Tax=Hevea brasiliensis TaxID=3981 RepID=A0A6A6N355_HEVBR|nr:hypothetical protein GH714_018234 [Hevea brasiliensis]